MNKSIQALFENDNQMFEWKIFLIYNVFIFSKILTLKDEQKDKTTARVLITMKWKMFIIQKNIYNK